MDGGKKQTGKISWAGGGKEHMSEKIWGGKAKLKSHLRGRMEYIVEALYNIYSEKGILMKSSKIRKTEPQLAMSVIK